MYRYLKTAIFYLIVGTLPLFSYDMQTANILHKTFSGMTQENLSKGKCKISADKVMQMLKEKKDFVILDVRTPAEQSVLAITTKNVLNIPANVLFTKENLDKLPTDKPIVVVCYSGSRAQQVALGLRVIGFMNLQVLSGGIQAFAKNTSYKKVPVLK
jgi:rhodanese-related sulfurtransferase